MPIEHPDLMLCVWIWLAGMPVTAVVVGAIACRDDRDRSMAGLIAPLWPIFAMLGIAVGTLWLLTELGAWIGRAVQQKFSH